MNLPGPSIRIGDLAFCASCDAAFSTSEKACPRCAAEIGIFRLITDHPSQEMRRLRETLELAAGAFAQIAFGKFSTGFKVRLAEKALDQINKTKRPAPSDVVAGQKGEELN
jgi:hypothetical protein